MALQESGEMYLETILVLSKKMPYVRSVDVGEHMGYSKPSVSRAVSLLKGGGFITVNGEGYIFLTEAGRTVAEKIYDRHNVIKKLLMELGVSEEVAVEDACKMEHSISDESLEAIKKHITRMKGEKE